MSIFRLCLAVIHHTAHARQLCLGNHPFSPLLHEAGARLVENRTQASKLLQQNPKQYRIQMPLPILDHWLLCQNDFLRDIRVGREEPPIDESSVPQVRIVRLLCRVGEHQLDELLGPFAGLLEEQLDGCRHEL